jgi:CheY-like chemotaxis protein
MAKTLLLADDSVTIQKVVGISFANEDVEILTVDNGDDALARAREAVPDIILADVVMPGKNGYEVCEALKADAVLSHIPVLLLTGTFEAFDEERAQSARANGHITKPFEAQALVDKVNALLANAPAAPTAPPSAAAAPTESGADLQSDDDDGFDFFADEAEAGDPGLPADGPEPATTAFELDAGESAFDFAPLAERGAPPEAGAELGAIAPATTPPPSDATIALGVAPAGVELPTSEDDWPTSDELDAAFDEDGLSGSGSPAPVFDEAPQAQTTLIQLDRDDDTLEPDTSPDLEFDAPVGAESVDDLLGGFGGPEPSRQAVLDPDEDQDFAVSSSDLGDPLAAPDFGVPDVQAELDAAPVEAAAPAAPLPGPEFAPEPMEPVEAEPIFESPDEEPIPVVLETEPEPVAVEYAFEAPPETDYPGSDPDLPGIPTHPSQTLAEPEAMPQHEAPPQSEAQEVTLGPDLTPMMRERVHESLEKIAWEAFADLPEAIVRQALQRIEEIAWEVIPQMAESLIREEIRRMKGDSE